MDYVLCDETNQTVALINSCCVIMVIEIVCILVFWKVGGRWEEGGGGGGGGEGAIGNMHDCWLDSAASSL